MSKKVGLRSRPRVVTALSPLAEAPWQAASSRKRETGVSQSTSSKGAPWSPKTALGLRRRHDPTRFWRWAGARSAGLRLRSVRWCEPTRRVRHLGHVLERAGGVTVEPAVELRDWNQAQTTSTDEPEVVSSRARRHLFARSL